MDILGAKRSLHSFRGARGLFDCDCACADYKPVADASKEAAEIMAQLGRDQLAEARRQYDANQAKLNPVIDAQIKQMGLAYDQGVGSFNRLKSAGWGLQDQLTSMAQGQKTAAQERAITDARTRAVADTKSALANQQGQQDRQMARMGVNPNSGKFAAMQGAQSIEAAKATASSANDAASKADDKFYARVGDAYNTYSGLGSQAVGLYGAGNSAGNSAVSNQMGIGSAYMQGMGQSANTTQSGLSMGLNGLIAAANGEQAGYANMGNLNGLGQMVSTGLGAAASYYGAKSDRRLKQNVDRVGRDERTGLALYEFEYINGDGTRYRGVMADEVESRFPDAVSYDDLGFASVDYGMLGIEMVEVAR